MLCSRHGCASLGLFEYSQNLAVGESGLFMERPRERVRVLVVSSQTKAALAKFQRAHGLPANSKMSTATLNALGVILR